MQLKITMQPSKPLCVPFNYNYQLQSAVYAKLAEINASDFWHDNGFGEFKKFKAFNFGSLKGLYRVKNNKICFENKVSFEIRSPVFDFCDDLQRAIEIFPDLKLFDTELKITEASFCNRHINKSQVTFTTETPVTVYIGLENGSTRYFTPNDDEFFIGICNNYENKFESICRREPERIFIRPVGEFKKVVTSYKGTWINAYKGAFEVRGSCESLEFLYNTGMGAKNSQGFGFLNIRE